MSCDGNAACDDRRKLRQSKRDARRSLSAAARQAAEAAIVTHVRAIPAYRAARRVAAFLAFDGEPNLARLLRAPAGKRFFVPVIDDRFMRFAALQQDTATVGNQFGIQEPRQRRFVPIRTLDVVLTPLVAFDDRGNRVGVGRGYYDRCFSTLLGRQHWFHPKLIGVAFECQREPSIASRAWDVPLWGIVTERGFRTFERG